MGWQGILVKWEAPLFWATFGIIGGAILGWLIARDYYKKTSKDMGIMRDEIITAINESEASEEVKEALRARTEGIFYTYSWEKEVAERLKEK
jgi:hypothetical protein